MDLRSDFGARFRGRAGTPFPAATADLRCGGDGVPALPGALDLTAVGLLLLRVVAGALIFWVHGWHKVPEGIAYLRDGTPWRLVAEIAEMHFPLPVVSAFAATLVQFVCAPLLVVGWFTRLNAFLLTGTLGIAILQNLLTDRDPQLALLYTTITAALVFLGAGRLSLDARGQPVRREP